MNNQPKVICIGEVLVDFVATVSGVRLKDAPAFARKAGGAPANVAVGIARLGTPSAFVGSVGDDSFGHFLTEQLQQAGVDVGGVTFDRTRKTRLAFVSLTAGGDRDFEFWENHPADEHLAVSGRLLKKLRTATIVHISSFMLLKEPARSSVLRIARFIEREGSLISFDPNLRMALWKSPAEARRVLRAMVKHTSILRLNEEEAEFLTGMKTIANSARALRAEGPALVVITRGARGCYFQTEEASGNVKGFSVNVVDTTGCGDAFLAALLHGLVERTGNLSSICRTANAVGALTALRRGAMAALPTRRQLDLFLRERT